MLTTATRNYTSLEICDRAGISYRMLDYWCRTGLITPSIQEATGSGTIRLFSDGDLNRIRGIAALRRAGVDLDRVREQDLPGVIADLEEALRILNPG